MGRKTIDVIDIVHINIDMENVIIFLYYDYKTWTMRENMWLIQFYLILARE